jgi:hypothetical protein
MYFKPVTEGRVSMKFDITLMSREANPIKEFLISDSLK